MKAIVAENGTQIEVRTHDFYLLNSVVCLEDEWSKPFSFIQDSKEEIENFNNKTNSEDDLYECDDPILKLNLDRIETKTE